MNDKYIQQIRDRIATESDGTVFSTSDFSDVADKNTIRQCMYRLVNDGTLRRILNGIYEKPEYSDFLDEYVAADPDKVAKALARCFRWTIAPCGNTALNLLGLSTQVPAAWSYISDGPYKTYEWDSTRIEFKHRTNKEITGMSYITALLIQAIKTLGRESITQETIRYLSEKFTNEEKIIILDEASNSTDWVYSIIKRICEAKDT